MIKVVVSGAKGRMGSHISQFVGKQNDFELVAGVDPVASVGEKLAYIDETGQSGEAPLFPSLDDALGTVDVDVVIDFTAPAVFHRGFSEAKDLFFYTKNVWERQLQFFKDNRCHP